jgi:hypothetical protein
MAKDLSPERMEIHKRARELARKAGKYWRDMSKDDRRGFLRQARDGGSQSSNTKLGSTGQNSTREVARAAAIKDGRKWRDLSSEERQKYLAQARRA